MYTIFSVGKTMGFPHLDNKILIIQDDGKELAMSKNNSKIRREVLINDVKVWITANSEQEYADKLIRLAGGANSNKPEKHRFFDYAEHWYRTFSQPNVSNVTSITYARQLKNYIYPNLGDKHIEDITPYDVQDVFNKMGSSAKLETKNKVKIVLNQIFKTAVDENIIPRNPLQSTSIKIKGEAATATEPYTVDEMRYLASHIADVQRETDRRWLAISISLPLRPEEVLGLKWSDVDLDNCLIHVRNTVTHPTRNEPEFKPYTKTASSIRTLAFPKEILPYLGTPGAPEEFVIGGKRPLSYTELRGLRKRINRNISFGSTITPRRFRTTVATDISAMTHDLKLVQQMLGHSTPEMTLKHYDKGRSTSTDASNAIIECYGLGKATEVDKSDGNPA